MFLPSILFKSDYSTFHSIFANVYRMLCFQKKSVFSAKYMLHLFCFYVCIPTDLLGPSRKSGAIFHATKKRVHA